ncbi:LysM peptidoglycan-binding domain-containing M23 family metallopeptidase [Effusibacillus consociatus]|uniref:LysM peptidoglycan-binding domain-containing M23 family metallopeptidase n=1 Tax=Effusibacillus consociatus TaxID=1117041 RepID=A0ABV9Q5M2_9BACL
MKGLGSKHETVIQTSKDKESLVTTIKQQISKTFTVRKSIAVAVLLTFTTFGGLKIQESIENTGLYYKVYIDGRYVGLVKDTKFVIDKVSSLDGKMSAKVSFVPVHQRLNGETPEAAILIAINESMHPKVQAVAIFSNDRQAVVVRDIASAQAVVDSVKARFASGGSTVKEVKIREQIDYRNVLVKRDEIRSVDSAVAMLLQGEEKPKKYLVSRGESLWTIASRNKVSVEKLKAANPKITDENDLHEGEEISISSIEPLITVETVEEITRTVQDKFETIYRDDANLNLREQRVLNEGQDGKKLQRVQIHKKNGKVDSEVVISEQVTKEKVNKVVLRGTKRNPTIAAGDWVWPVASRAITSPFGERRGSQVHNALDIAAPTGNAIYASNNGTVIYAGWDGGYGKTIRISHGNGVVSTYAHLSSINVSVGQQVNKGAVIGGVGSTGNSTGPHLHYEVRVNGAIVNPAPYM